MQASRLAIVAAAVIGLGVTAAQAEPAGLYLRGEAGWSWAHSNDFSDRQGQYANGCVICNSPGPSGLGSSALLGAGVGYRLTDLFRVEAMVDYRGWYKLDGTDGQGTQYRADASSLAGMLNGYVDLPWNLGPVKPYLGAGLGVAHNRLGAITQSFTIPGIGAGYENDPGGSRTNFAWQAMLGLSWAVSDRITVDAGYRYFDGGKMQSSAGTSTFGVAGSAINVPTDGISGRFTASEAVIGLRYRF